VRLRVRLRSGLLDRELADGCAPGSSEDRRLRAKQLLDPVTRRRLARSLREVVAAAERPGAAQLGSAVPVRREAVMSLREGLLGLAERLELPVAVNPSGVARAAVLLTDGMGPLYSCSSPHSLTEALWWVVDGLQLCPPHAWRCPVLMKLDPEHVAWTCERCGAVARTDDPSVKPT